MGTLGLHGKAVCYFPVSSLCMEVGHSSCISNSILTSLMAEPDTSNILVQVRILGENIPFVLNILFKI